MHGMLRDTERSVRCDLGEVGRVVGGDVHRLHESNSKST